MVVTYVYVYDAQRFPLLGTGSAIEVPPFAATILSSIFRHGLYRCLLVSLSSGGL